MSMIEHRYASAVNRAEKFRKMVDALPCQHCGAHTAKAVQRSKGKGPNLKTSSALVVALCRFCNARMEQDDMDQKEKHAFWDDAYIRQTQALIEQGRLKA